MTPKEFNQQNHEFLADFVKNTKDDYGNISTGVIATIVQFLMNLRVEFNIIADENDGTISKRDLINIQIKELRQCIVDLQQHLKHNKEVIQ